VVLKNSSELRHGTPLFIFLKSDAKAEGPNTEAIWTKILMGLADLD